ncbi:MAG: hypothetical protein V1827_05830, partial [Candidatus Micrarchaeota archaeon]
MAGGEAQLRQSAAKNPRPILARAATPFLRLFGKEMASVEAEGKTFYALVDKGTKFEGALDRMIAKYGGGIATLKYDDMEGREIVAVMIGDRCIVKGEPDKVARADFSSFGENAGAMRDFAIARSRDSKGGIHFFVGKNGIPIAVGAGGEVIFPNASEVEVGSSTSFFSIRLVDYEVDPRSMSELGNGSLAVSRGASSVIAEGLSKDEMAKSHGGVRSEKLMLTHSKLLIYDMLSDRVATASEYANGAPETGFKAPQFDTLIPVKETGGAPFSNVGIVYATKTHAISLPMDGSTAKVPYSYVKVFDGTIQEALSFNMSDMLQSVPGMASSVVSPGADKRIAASKACRGFRFVPYEPLALPDAKTEKPKEAPPLQDTSPKRAARSRVDDQRLADPIDPGLRDRRYPSAIPSIRPERAAISIVRKKRSKRPRPARPLRIDPRLSKPKASEKPLGRKPPSGQEKGASKGAGGEKTITGGGGQEAG